MYKREHLTPIIISEYNDVLREFPFKDEETGIKYPKPDNQLLKSCSCIGVHDICNCWMDIKETSKTHKTIICRGCGLRITIPLSINTYGDLRRYFKQWNQLGYDLTLQN